MNLKSTICGTRAGSVAGKLIISVLGLSIILLIGWVFTRADVSSQQLNSKPVNTSGPQAPTPTDVKHRKAKTVATQKAVPSAKPVVTALDRVYPNQELWKRSMLETNGMLWCRTVRGKLTDEMKPELLEYFGSQTNISFRISAATELAHFGGADVVQAFALALTNDYRNTTLPDWDVMTLSRMLRTMKYMVNGTPEAFAFCKQALEFEFWEKHPPYGGLVDARGNPTVSRIQFFVGSAIHVCAYSTSPEVPLLLEQLRDRDINYTYYTVGAIMDAVCEQDRRWMLPAPAGTILDGESRFRWHQEWLTTDSGRKWAEWSGRILKARPTIQR